jgi:transcriptional regulator with XRE-family HTH domain
MTPDQVVSWNLLLARKLRGWTQDEAAERLEPYLGQRLSKAAFSAAERAHRGGRVRRFNATELHALARGFDLPITYFFIPPYGGVEVAADGAAAFTSGVDMCDLLFSVDEPTRRRLTGVLQTLDLRGVVRVLLRYRDEASVAVDEVQEGIEQALQAADQLDDPKLKRRAQRALGEETD